MVVVENYPNLKSDRPSATCRRSSEGTENRITVARGRYIKTVQDYNTYVRSFPQNLTAMMFGHKQKPNFTVENEARDPGRADRRFRQRSLRAGATRQPADAPAHRLDA